MARLDGRFIEGLERVLGRPIARRAAGRKPALKADQTMPLF